MDEEQTNPPTEITVSDELTSEPVADNEICVDIPKVEDVAFKAVRYNDHTTLVRRLNEGFNINTRHVEEPGDTVYTVKDWTRMVRQLRLKQYSLLHVAVIHGKMETIKLLLSHGVDINLTDENRMSPISVAAAIHRPDVVNLLIKEGADVNIQSVSGRTPLIQAITNNSLTTVQLLITAGADLDLADMKGTTPLFACLTSSKNMELGIIKALLKGGCSVDLANKQGATPLMMAVGLGRIDAMKILLDAGADINMIDKAGKNVFHMAVGVKTALFLINNGATCDLADKHGVRPIDRCAQVGHIGMIRLLLGCDCLRTTAILDVPRMVQARQSLPVFDRWLHEELYNPRDLKRLCRQTIRQSLSPTNTARVHELPIPSLLKDYILAKHLELTFDNLAQADVQYIPSPGGLGGILDFQRQNLRSSSDSNP